jgi:hypothetical protein
MARLDKAAVVSMLTNYVGVVINTADDDHEVMKLLRRHPRAKEKLEGKRRVLVEHHYRGYITVKVDGELISWNKCVKGAE